MGLISNGSTIFDNGSMASGFGGSMVFIKKLTANDSANLTFIHGTADVVLDSTYKEYVFLWKDVHATLDAESDLLFNVTTDGTNFNVAKTGTAFEAYHFESGTTSNLRYGPATAGLAQGTGNSLLAGHITNASDGSSVGSFNLFNPSSTTFVKHYIVDTNYYHNNARSYNLHIAGYANTTSAITGIRFLMSNGNMASGDICLYGIA